MLPQTVFSFFFFFPPSEQHSYICKKNFSSGARAPLRQHRAACLMRSRCEETWEAEMLLESLSHSVNWCLQLANTDSWYTWVFLFYFLSFPFFFFFTAGVFDVSCRHRGRVVSTHDVTGPHWALESSFDGPLMKCGLWKKQHRRVLFISFKAAAPLWIIWAFPSWSHYLKRAGFALKSLVLHKADTVVWQCAPDRAPPGGGWSTGPRNTSHTVKHLKLQHCI